LASPKAGGFALRAARVARATSKFLDGGVEFGSELMGSLVFGAIWAGKATRVLAEYLKHAEECRRLAESMAAPADKRLLQELARTWERLAAARQNDITPDDIKI
jgi:hypothetical protein